MKYKISKLKQGEKEDVTCDKHWDFIATIEAKDWTEARHWVINHIDCSETIRISKVH